MDTWSYQAGGAPAPTTGGPALLLLLACVEVLSAAPGSFDFLVVLA